MPHLPGAAKDYTWRTNNFNIVEIPVYFYPTRFSALRTSYLLKATEPDWLFPFHPFLLDLSQSFPDDGLRHAAPRRAAPRRATAVMDV